MKPIALVILLLLGGCHSAPLTKGTIHPLPSPVLGAADNFAR